MRLIKLRLYIYIEARARTQTHSESEREVDRTVGQTIGRDGKHAMKVGWLVLKKKRHIGRILFENGRLADREENEFVAKTDGQIKRHIIKKY